jgi:hypothetical protein
MDREGIMSHSSERGRDDHRPVATYDDRAKTTTTLALPPIIVTRDTRRETFASSSSSSMGRTRTTGNAHRLASTTSAGAATSASPRDGDASYEDDEEDDGSMMDVFSPPMPTSTHYMRGRSRPITATIGRASMSEDATVDDIVARTHPANTGVVGSSLAATTSARSKDASVDDGESENAWDVVEDDGANYDDEDESSSSHRPRHRHHRQGDDVTSSRAQSTSYQSPPTVYTPHTATMDRIAMSTTSKRQYEGRVVHVPKTKGPEDDENDGYNAYDDNDDELVEEEGCTGVGGGRARTTVFHQHSAPARMTVSSCFAPIS